MEQSVQVHTIVSKLSVSAGIVSPDTVSSSTTAPSFIARWCAISVSSVAGSSPVTESVASL
jgi:hypothetical protein